ncbi:DNA methyltransferase [Verrucomicrobiota bacterium]
MASVENQLRLFSKDGSLCKLETRITRVGDRLEIPEGLHTIPCTHGLHRFPGKFIPNLPRYLVRQYLQSLNGDVVIDPFCGSGTTLVELALEGRTFVGLDFDPLAILISKAKTTLLPDEILSEFLDAWRGFDYSEERSDLFPDVPNLRHWFTETALAELSAIKGQCLEFREPLRTFALAVFSSIIRRVSNADDQTQKTYVSHTLPKTPPKPHELFPVFAQRALDGMGEYGSLLSSTVRGKIVKGDARCDVEQHEFVHVLTSPPYIDSIDYMYNQMLEYFWLLPELGIDSYDCFRKMRRDPMGFRLHDPEEIEEELRNSLGDEFDVLQSVCSEIVLKSPKESAAVMSFFYDYLTHLKKTRDQQITNGYYLCVIGNSLIRGVQVPTVDILCGMFKGLGYKIEDVLRYEIRRHYMKFPRRGNSGKIKTDYVIVAKLSKWISAGSQAT